jgi:hypothetical protein
MRIYRLGLATPVIAALALMTSAGSAVAAQQPTDRAADSASLTTPAEYYDEGEYLTVGMCQNGGNTGIAEGKWKAFTCAPTRIGLDVWFTLYVTL